MNETTEEARLSQGTSLKSLCFHERLRDERAESHIGRAVMDGLTHQASLSHKQDSRLMQILQVCSPASSNLSFTLIVPQLPWLSEL